jgi:hypothetical protein
MSLPNPAELISQMAIRLKAYLEHRTALHRYSHRWRLGRPGVAR